MGGPGEASPPLFTDTSKMSAQTPHTYILTSGSMRPSTRDTPLCMPGRGGRCDDDDAAAAAEEAAEPAAAASCCCCCQEAACTAAAPQLEGRGAGCCCCCWQGAARGGG